MESLWNSMADTFRAKRFLVRMRKLAGGEEDSGGVCSIFLAALYCKRDHKSRDVDRARGNTLKSRYTCFFRAASPVALKETTETHRTLGYASGKSIFGCSVRFPERRRRECFPAGIEPTQYWVLVDALPSVNYGNAS